MYGAGLTPEIVTAEWNMSRSVSVPALAGEQAAAKTAEEAIVSRRSIRRFLPAPVARETVEHLLAVASRAPSGVNSQPWRVYVLGGERKEKLSAALVDAHFNAPEAHQTEVKYSPDRLPEPYKSRQREVGWGLYNLLGIEKGDREKTRAQHARNYRFFDAPVGLIFTLDRVLEIGSWLDYGMFLQSLMVAARGMGLHTCPQMAFAKYHRLIREQLGIPEDEIIICGMSMGHPDTGAPENQLETPREPVSGFATFFDL